MPTLKMISNNDVFRQDLMSQIGLYASDFAVSDDLEPDVVFLDEDFSLLQGLQKKYAHTPIFVFLPENAEDMPSAPLVFYFRKPLELSALLNTLKASINLAANSEAGVLKFNRYELFPLQKEILNKRNNQRVKLTERETAILQYLYKIKDKIVTKSELLENVWGYHPDAATHTIETHIYRLRQKVEGDDVQAQLILTEDGGYRLKR